MTAAELVAWQKRCGLRTQTAAARVLRLALSTYRDKVHGRSPVDDRTELLSVYYEVHAGQWLAVAEAARKLALLTDPPVAPAAARTAHQTLQKLMPLR
jgi:hypothetical protein